MEFTITKERHDVDEHIEVNYGANLILHNDDHNDMDWVVESLVDVCEHTLEQAEQCTLIVHHKGKYAVRHGEFEKLRPMRHGLVDRGLNATIEEV